jgi:hypothetical protein
MKAALPLLLVVATIGVTACGTLKAVDEMPGSTLRFADKGLLASSFGRGSDTNPYMEPSGFFTGKFNEFVVLQLDLVLVRPAKVRASASLASPDGVAITARLMDARSLLDYWSDLETTTSERTDDRRRSNIYRSALPALDFTAPAGRSRYFLVLSGSNPLPRPAQLRAEVDIEGEESLLMDEAIPPLPGK